MGIIAVLGGTGPEGLGLAMRLAQIGEEVVIGSRDAARAEEAAARVRADVPTAVARGLENPAAAAAASTVVLAFPHAGAEPFLAAHAALLAGKVVIDVMVPLRFAHGVCLSVPLADPSLAETVARLAPEARVVAAFKNLSAEHLQHLDRPLAGDVFACGDDREAKEAVLALAARLPGVRAVDAGPLSSAAALERLTVMQLNINRRYKAVTSIRIVGLP